jgi:DNA helicase-2/ATP-dependent DNA helicase PcrA
VEYLEEAALVREDKDDEEESTGVNLSTVHGAKGLEFHTVFVIGCEEQLFPHWRSMEQRRRPGGGTAAHVCGGDPG